MDPQASVEDTTKVNGELCILDHTGDTKMIWDARNEDEVEAVRRTFDDLKRKGYLAYSVSKDGSKGEVIREFDPSSEKIIMSPPMVGG